MGHLHMFAKNDDTNEDIHAADRVLVAHRYNCSDNPINVAREKLYENSETTRLHQAGKDSHSSPTEDTSDLYSLYAYHTIKDVMGNPLDPVLYCCKDIQGELRPILTTLKPALESLMEIKLCRHEIFEHLFNKNSTSFEYKCYS